jgi:hypothetical protein
MQQLFNNPGVNLPPQPQDQPYPHVPTMEELFGTSPFVTSPRPGGTGPYGAYSYNPSFFATPETAEKVRVLLGGLAVEAVDAMTPAGSFQQNTPNNMVRMPILAADTDAAGKGEADNNGVPIDPKGRLINAGVIANLFSHGYASIALIEQPISDAVGFAWNYVQPAPVPVTPPPASQPFELLAGSVGSVALQADGTTWKRLT